MIYRIKTYILSFLLIILASSMSGQEDAKEIYTKATDQLLTGDMELLLEMDITDKKGRMKQKSFMVLAAKFGDTEKTKMSWEKPVAAKGTTVVFTNYPGDVEGLIEVFTPSNGKIRKLKATPENLKMVGSEVNMTNFTAQDPEELSFSLLENQEVDGKLCHNIEVKAKDNSDASKEVLLIEKDSYRIVQITVFDDEGNKISFAELSNFQPVDGLTEKVQPMHIKTKNFENKKLTEMRVLKISSRTDLKEEDFQLPAAEGI